MQAVVAGVVVTRRLFAPTALTDAGLRVTDLGPARL